MHYRIERLAEDVSLGLYSIRQGREEERRGERELLRLMLGKKIVLSHNADGKPLIPEGNISISHTKGYVAILFSHSYSVGIDIEFPSERVKRVASRFLRPDEAYESLTDLQVVWCAKETLYKLHSSEHLSLNEMKVRLAESELVNMRRGRVVPFLCWQTPDYIMTAAWEREINCHP